MARRRLLWAGALAAGGWTAGACEHDEVPRAAASGEVAPPGVAAQGNGYQLKLLSTRTCPPRVFERPERGHHYLGLELELTVASETARRVPVNAHYARLERRGGEPLEPLFAGSACEPPFSAPPAAAGQLSRGWVVFEVPDGARDLELEYAPRLADGQRAAVRLAVQP